MKANIGIDIGKRKCDVCVIDGNGRVLERGQYPNTVSAANKFAKKMADKYLTRKGSCKAACETTGNMWAKTCDAFEQAGIEIKLANTFKMAMIAKTGKKTDKVDAEKIAQILRMDMIPECYKATKDIRDIRTVIRQRVRLVQDRTRVINRVHSLLDRYDDVVDASSMYSASAIEQMKNGLPVSERDSLTLNTWARDIEYLTDEIKQLDGHLVKDAARNEYAQLLTSLTGMGTFVSLLLAVEIGDIGRFDSPKKLVSWAGLCPIVHQSGDNKYMGQIKKIDRDELVNWAMCEAANTAAIHDPRMKFVYKRAKQRHAGRHAYGIVAVANKMITIAWHILKTKTPYKSRNEQLYKRKLAKMERARQK